MNSSSGVTARFIELFREKVERKVYQLKRTEQLTLDEVRRFVIAPETNEANRAFVHLVKTISPKENPAELVHRQADVLLLHSSWSDLGVDFLDAIESCYTYRVNSLCVDLFSTVYECDPDLTPIPTPQSSEVDTDRGPGGEQLPNELGIALDVGEPGQGENNQDETDDPNAQCEQGPDQNMEEVDGKDNRAVEVPKIELDIVLEDAEDDGTKATDDHLSASAAKTQSSGGFQNVEVDMGRKNRHRRRSDVSNQSSEAEENEAEDTLAFFLDDTEEKAGRDKQERGSSPTALNPEGFAGQISTGEAIRDGKMEVHTGKHESDVDNNGHVARKDESLLVVGNQSTEPNEARPELKTNNEESGKKVTGANQKGSGETEDAESRPESRNSNMSVENKSSFSNYSVKSWKSFVNKFTQVYLVVNLEKMDELLADTELVTTLAMICSPVKIESRRSSRMSSNTGDSIFLTPTLELISTPQSREKTQNRELYAFFQRSFVSIQCLDNFVVEDEESSLAEGVKSFQQELYMYLFKCCEKRKSQLFSIELDEATKNADVDMSDCDWLVQLARSKWILEIRLEALFIYELALKIKMYLNGELSDQNAETVRELCDWRKIWDDKDRAIQLLKKLIEIRRQKNSEDNILFSDLNAELGQLFEANGQFNEATQSYLDALRVETVNRGSDHPDVATAQNHLGRIHFKQGNFDESLKFLGKARKIREYYFGEENLKTGEVYSNMGDTWLSKGDSIKALDFYQKSVKCREGSLNAESDPECLLGEIYQKVGGAHFFRCDFLQAIDWYERSLETLEQQLQPNDAVFLHTQHLLAKALHSFGRYVEARSLYMELLQKYQFGRDDFKTIAVLEDLGLLYQETGEFRKAKRTFLQVTELRGD